MSHFRLLGLVGLFLLLAACGDDAKKKTFPPVQVNNVTDAGSNSMTGDASTDSGGPNNVDDPCPANGILCGGRCVDGQTDPSNCGGCGETCGIGEICVGGGCEAAPGDCRDDGCPAGFFCETAIGQCEVGCDTSSDCPGGASCDVATRLCLCPGDQNFCFGACISDDAYACGANCTTCSAPANGTPVCNAGVCDFECADGFNKCGDQCVPDDDPTQCGEGCIACPVPPGGNALCIDGACEVECQPGFHSCNGTCVSDDSPASCGDSCTPCPADANGAATCNAGQCGTSCNPGFHLCNGVCVSDTDPNFCGASCRTCPVPANGLAICSGGSCDVACSAGFHECNGRCVRNNDPATCGSRCNPCSDPLNGFATCDGTSCGIACDFGFHECNGQCVSNTNVNTCGSRCSPCPAPANGSATCNGTSCGVRCNSGFHECNGQCVSNTSPLTCGNRCTPCPTPANATASCNAGQCDFTCNFGYQECNGQCVPQNSPTACGPACVVCSAPSNASPTCVGGGCDFACNTGFHECNGQCVNSSSPATCGNRCTPCPSPANATATCTFGSCGFECSAGFVAAGSSCVPAANLLSLGGYHTTGIDSSGQVRAWGRGDYGQVGDGASTTVATPRTAALASLNIVQVESGNLHSLGVTSNGALYCWGNDFNGQCGHGISYFYPDSPYAVPTFTSGVIDAAAGDDHSCVLLSNRSVRCFGGNDEGQLGDNSTTDSTTPVFVSGISSAIAIDSGGGDFTCALLNGGAVQCWGSNDYGQLGNNTTVDSSVPVLVQGLTARSISVGRYHACAVTTTGAARCWGRNVNGSLGNGSRTNSSVPVNVTGLSSGVAFVAAGGYHSCAIDSAGAVRCWGSNWDGQIGDGTTTYRTTPVAVTTLTSSTAFVSAGFYHSCALQTDGDLYCWGEDDYGATGYLNDFSNLTTPRLISVF